MGGVGGCPIKTPTGRLFRDSIRLEPCQRKSFPFYAHPSPCELRAERERERERERWTQSALARGSAVCWSVTHGRP